MEAKPLVETKGPQRQAPETRRPLDLRAYAMVAALGIIWLFFFAATDGAFLTARNMSNLAVQMSVTSILATGMVLVIVAGHVDLSVGSVLGLTGGLAAVLEVWAGWPFWLAASAALLLGALIGALNGWLVAYQRIPAFIVTLAGMMAFRGILLGATKGVTVSGLSKPFQILGQSFVPAGIGLGMALAAALLVAWGLMRQRRTRERYGLPVARPALFGAQLVLWAVLLAGFALVMNAYEGIPVAILIVAILVALFQFLATRTRFGRYIYAIGGNAEAARFSGIAIARESQKVFILAGTLAAVAGLVMTSRLGAATITAGQSYELDAVAACVIGGTSLAGGRGSITGAIVGALVMASLDNGMSMMNTDAYWQYIVKGLILVLAVWVDVRSKERGVLA